LLDLEILCLVNLPTLYNHSL